MTPDQALTVIAIFMIIYGASGLVYTYIHNVTNKEDSP